MGTDDQYLGVGGGGGGEGVWVGLVGGGMCLDVSGEGNGY